VRRRRDDRAGDDTVLEDAARVVHVLEEHLEHLDALLDALLDARPRLHLDDARQDVERERAFLATDVEGDALVEVGRRERVHAAAELRLRHVGERVGQLRVRRAEAVVGEHLVERRTRRTGVSLEHGRHGADVTQDL
jgi:hypothetical protein